MCVVVCVIVNWSTRLLACWACFFVGGGQRPRRAKWLTISFRAIFFIIPHLSRFLGRCLDFYPVDGSALAVGCVDGSILIVDTRTSVVDTRTSTVDTRTSIVDSKSMNDIITFQQGQACISCLKFSPRKCWPGNSYTPL